MPRGPLHIIQQARAGLAHLWVEDLGHPGRPLANVLGVHPAIVFKAARRGAKCARVTSAAGDGQIGVSGAHVPITRSSTSRSFKGNPAMPSGRASVRASRRRTVKNCSRRQSIGGARLHCCGYRPGRCISYRQDWSRSW